MARRFVYNSPKYKRWRDKVFIRDNFTCRLCSQKGGALNAHHIKRKADFPHLAHRRDNGITLCTKCHDVITEQEELFEPLFIKVVSGTLTTEYVYQFFAELTQNYKSIIKDFKKSNKWLKIPGALFPTERKDAKRSTSSRSKRSTNKSSKR